jgi:hypothetical protein
MARIRTVKPELFRHEALFEAELETKLPLRISFIALFTVCDREGRFRWRPRQLKLDCLPYDEIDFSRVLYALATREFVVPYEVSGVKYGVIPSFTRHQVINNRESESVLPDIPENYHAVNYENAETVLNQRLNNCDNSELSRVSHASATRHDLAQVEGKRKRKRKRNMEEEEEGRVANAPEPKKQAKPKLLYETIELPEFIDRQLWVTWQAQRKAKNGSKAIQTDRTFEGHIRQLTELQNEGILANQCLIILADIACLGVNPPMCREKLAKSQNRINGYQHKVAKNHEFQLPPEFDAIESTATQIDNHQLQNPDWM